ncbi:MAG: hypothetical protein K2N06_07280 [Oscillospiraceae bacterium]|nr:hypothetical protein [Oscillospiraceae bacterium]
MNFCGLSEKFLEDAKRIGTYDPNMPLQFRVMAKVLMDNDYVTARALLEANRGEFDGEYGYEVLDTAVEMCLNITDEYIVDGRRVKRPVPETVEFIDYLLKNGANPNLPKHFNQIEHINDVEEDSSHQCRCEFDCSEIRNLLNGYM